jgi:hypothetical protein
MKTKPLLSTALALIALGAGVAQAQPANVPKNRIAMEGIEAVRGGHYVYRCFPRRNPRSGTFYDCYWVYVSR